MTRREESQRVHEQLGAPILLYRHAPSYTGWESTPPEPWGLDRSREPRYVHERHQGLNRARARWYYAVDHLYRRELERPPERKRKKRRQRGGEKSEESLVEGGGSPEQSAVSKDESNEESDGKTRSGRKNDATSSFESELETESVEDGAMQHLAEEARGDSEDSSAHKRAAASGLLDFAKGLMELQASDEEEEWSPGSDVDSSDDDDDTDDSSGTPPDERVPKKLKMALWKDDPLYNRDFIEKRTDQTVYNARKHLLGHEPDSHVLLRSYQQYDHPYIPGQYRTGECKTTRSSSKWRVGLSETRKRISHSMFVDRVNSDTSYLAPMNYGALNYCFDENDSVTEEEKRLSTTKRRQVTYPIGTDSIYPPTRYGNCLVCVPCPCEACGCNVRDSTDASSSKRHGWCLLHPTGELLSRVCVSNLLLPHGAQNASIIRRFDHSSHIRPERHELDVGEKILQISPCGKGNISESSSDDARSGLFVARSLNYCTVIQISSHIFGGKTKTPDPNVCQGSYRLEEVARIDLRSLCRFSPSYQPMDVANHPRYGNQFSSSKFAILSHSRSGERNIIHHVLLQDASLVEEHTFPSLKAISRIDFTNTHPMTLWAAAESYVRPKLVSEIYSTKPYLGHGHSLYTADLRSNEAIFQWSPSAEEALVEGVHSISGIMTDWKKEHSVWVSSTSAGKTWEIDGRMPCRALNSFSLASACDFDKTLLPAMGLNGGGTLLTRPVVACYNTPVDTSNTFLSVDKSPGAFGLHVLQRPEFRPRFQTNSLESVSCPGLSSRDNGPKVSIAKSSSFALPDVSEGIFTCGLASFQTSASEFLEPNDIESLGYGDSTESVLCAVTMTSKGDIYSHALLECAGEDESQSKAFAGLPMGAKALAVPSVDNPMDRREESNEPERKSNGGWNFSLTLTNNYPCSSSQVVPTSVAARKDCRSFKTVRLAQLKTYPTIGSNDHDTQDAAPLEASSSENAVAQDAAPEAISSQSAQAAQATSSCEKFKSCFWQGRKSVVEHGNPDREAKQLRSDVTAETLQAVESLWNAERELAAENEQEEAAGYSSDEHVML